MVESWQRKQYYSPRVIIDANSILESVANDHIVCLTTQQLEMLRNLTQYLHRRVTFVEQYEKDYYVVPGESDWNDIQEMVADLEYRLMATTCEDIVTALQAIASCVCNIAYWQERIAATLPDLSGYVDTDQVTYLPVNEVMGSPSQPASDQEKCELAQAFYWYIYDAFTEKILPFANSTADQLAAAIIATCAFGAIATFVGIPVAILGVILGVVVSWGVEGAIANFTSWLYASKDEIVCILYQNLPNLDAAASALTTWVNSETSPSYLDKKVLLSMLASTWHMSFVMQDQQENGTWDTYIESGACDECGPPPMQCVSIRDYVGSDWDGGTVESENGRATLKAGWSAYTYETVEAIAYPSYLIFSWIPRSTTDTFARAKYGVRVDGVTVYMQGQTPNREKDIEWQEWVNLPAIAVGSTLELMIQQDAYWIEPCYFCLSDTIPT